MTEAHIEHHFETISSRREVARVEIDLGHSLTETEFDAAVMLGVERATTRTNERREYRGMSMNHIARRVIRYETINGILYAIWDDGDGNRDYEPVEDADGSPNW